MKLPQIISDNPAQIEKLVPGGQGIATMKDGIKGFFWNALPGEIITKYEITKQKSHYFEATALEIAQPSKHRIQPKDPCYLSTSPWQIMDYDYELKQKSLLLTEIFRQQDVPNLLDISKTQVSTDAQDFFYRNKMEYSLYYDYSDEKLHLGFHKRGTHRKIKVDSSSIERPEIFQKATEIVAELNARHADGRAYQSLLLRTNQNGKVSGGLYENHQPHPAFQNLTDTILGREYSYSPNGFFQINLPVYEMVLREIMPYVTTENVLDLYAGVGTIGLSIAKDKNLTLVEIDKSAFAELERNIRLLNVSETNTTFKDFSSRQAPMSKIPNAFLAKSEDVTDFIKSDQTVIVDPPRAGLDIKLTEKLLKTLPATIIYLSCNPITQARDIKILTEKYNIIKIQPFNFFPALRI